MTQLINKKTVDLKLNPFVKYLLKIKNSCLGVRQLRSNVVKNKILIKILHSSPISIYREEPDLEISSVTSHADCLPLILSLKSLLTNLKKFGGIGVTIFDDGSLTKNDFNLLNYHLVNARVIDKQKYNDRVQSIFKTKHIFNRKRNCPYVIKKVGAKLFCRSKKVIFLDSDVLFFREPVAIASWVEGMHDAFYIQDIEDAYCISNIEAQEIFKTNLVSRVNSGFLGIDKKYLDLSVLETLLKKLEELSAYRPLLLQTFFAIIMSMLKLKPLPSDRYIMSLEKNQPIKSAICRHYTRDMKAEFFKDASEVLKKGLIN